LRQSIRRPEHLELLKMTSKITAAQIGSVYNMSPAQYREKWGLSAHYPMVAPNYALKTPATGQNNRPRPPLKS